MDNEIANEFPPESDSNSDEDHTHHIEDDDVMLMSDLFDGIYFKQKHMRDWEVVKSAVVH